MPRPGKKQAWKEERRRLRRKIKKLRKASRLSAIAEEEEGDEDAKLNTVVVKTKVAKRIDRVHKKITSHEEKEDKDDPLAFQTPFRAQVVGGTGSGKTFWLVAYLMTIVQFDFIIWVTSAHSINQSKFDPLKEMYGDYIVFVEGPDFEQVEECIQWGELQGWRMCVVLDDMILESGKHPYIREMFVAFRHRNVSVFELLQAIFPPGARTQRLQCDYFVLFRFAAIDEAQHLFRQVAGRLGARRLQLAYNSIITRDRFGCLIIDLKGQSTPQFPLRVRDTQINRLIPSLWNVTTPEAE